MPQDRDVYVSRRGKEWMSTCHAQPDVLSEVFSDLIDRLLHVRAMGELYGKDPHEPIKKLEGFDNLWETRVRHRAGQFRQFFRFSAVAGRPAVIVVDGVAKKGDLPRRELAVFNARLDRYELALTDRATRDHDRMR
jgi:hypothetical protein